MPSPTNVYSYPTYTKNYHPGWYSRVTYLHTANEIFSIYDTVNAVYYNMFNQFGTSINKKGNAYWPQGYWSEPGIIQRIKGCFRIGMVKDTKFNITFGIEDQATGNQVSCISNNGMKDHLFVATRTLPVNFEFNICLNHIDYSTGRAHYFSIQGFYHYESDGMFDADSDPETIGNSQNTTYSHIPFFANSTPMTISDDVTDRSSPVMIFDVTSAEAINEIELLNLTIEELGG